MGWGVGERVGKRAGRGSSNTTAIPIEIAPSSTVAIATRIAIGVQ